MLFCYLDREAWRHLPPYRDSLCTTVVMVTSQQQLLTCFTRTGGNLIPKVYIVLLFLCARVRVIIQFSQYISLKNLSGMHYARTQIGGGLQDVGGPLTERWSCHIGTARCHCQTPADPFSYSQYVVMGGHTYQTNMEALLSRLHF